MDIERLGNYCKQFRIHELEMTLTRFSEEVGENLKNVSAFEHGRANNIKYLTYYYRLANEEQKQKFMETLFFII